MDIQFGNLEQSEPQLNLRPDQDGHFSVTAIGELATGELKIFVDLDVLRDMEAHARTNTRVELGGVMLGRQCVDDQGEPFVIVTDSLRARHYEATKGSFKFTHETWSQITRERTTFRPDLEMVGWYHTHPGWSVFLSGMDLFICNNFFNRPLDVALVIDPCADDRGWFQWLSPTLSKGRQTTGRTGGFFLTTGRFRQQELEHFACIYNKEPKMNNDPRYATNLSGQTGFNQPMVNLMDNRKPVFEMAMLSMLLMQFLLFAVVAWKLLMPITAPVADNQGNVAVLQRKLAELESSQLNQTRQQAFQEVLQSIVGAQTGEDDLVENFTELKTANQQLESNVVAQMALAEKLNRERDLANRAVLAKAEIVEKLSGQLELEQDDLKLAKQEITGLKQELAAASADGLPVDQAKVAGAITLKWWWLALGGLATASIAGPLGYWLAGFERSLPDVFDDRNDQDRMDRPFGELAKLKTERRTSGKTLT